MSDRIAVMNDGLVEQLGGPREIYERPATAFVAGFIGTSNLLAGTAAGGVLPIGGGRVLVPEQDGHVSVTVRPEKITISTEKPDGDVSVVPGTVAEVVYLGTYTSYAVSLVDGAEITVFQQNALDSTTTAERGDPVWLSWRAQHSYAIGS